MESKNVNRPFFYAFAAFTVMLTMSLAISWYIRAAVKNWIEKKVNDAAETITQLIDERWVKYKLNLYGLKELYTETNQQGDNEVVKLHRTAIVPTLAGSEVNIWWVRGNEAVLAGERGGNNKEWWGLAAADPNGFAAARKIAFKEERIVFGNYLNKAGEMKLAAVIPIDRETQKTLVAESSWESMVLPVVQTGLLEGANQVKLTISLMQTGGKEITLNNDTEEKAINVGRRQFSGLAARQKELRWDGITVELKFEEKAGAPLDNLLKQIPFTVLAAGTVVSILGFGGVFATMMLLEKEINEEKAFKTKGEESS